MHDNLVVAQFGGARLLTSRLARTLAPPKMQTVHYRQFGEVKTPKKGANGVRQIPLLCFLWPQDSGVHCAFIRFCARIGTMNRPSPDLRPPSPHRMGRGKG